MALALPLLLALAAPAAAGVALGAYGGYNFTIIQDDSDHGALFGLKAKIDAVPVVVLEPSITFISVGDQENEDDAVGTFTQSGGSIQAYALNANFGGSYKTEPGVGFYGTGGIGMYSMKPDTPYLEDESRFGFNAGAGFVVKPSPMFDIDVSARMHVITLDGGGSRKSVGIDAGADFYFGL